MARHVMRFSSCVADGGGYAGSLFSFNLRLRRANRVSPMVEVKRPF